MLDQSSTGRQRELTMPLLVKCVWVTIAIGLVVARMVWTELNIDAIALGLLLIAGLPWLLSIIETAKLPGGVEITMRKLERTVESQEQKVQEQSRELEKQQEIINQLVIYSMSDYIFWHLNQIYHGKRDGKEYLFRKNYNFEKDLNYLMDNGYIKYVDVPNMQDGTDLAKVVALTPVGEFMVEQREKLRAKQEAEKAEPRRIS